nr:ABC transporter ATP-binding protein [Propionicimonas sp.]
MTGLLEVENLSIGFPATDGTITTVVDKVSFTVEPGEMLGIVGESGSGKSMTMSACMQLIPQPGRILQGSIRFDGTELVGLPDSQMRRLRGRDISMVLQDAMTALHPAMTVERQMANVLTAGQSMSRQEVRRRSIETLEMAGIPDPEERLKVYPHQLSGGLRQRVMIAMSILKRPRLLIADEPTTALDVTLQEQIIELFRALNAELGLSVALVTHNFGVVAGLTDRTIVMKDGLVVEEGTTDQILLQPRQPYTQRLLAAVPWVDDPRTDEIKARPEEQAIVVRDVVCDMRPASIIASRKRTIRAVDHVSLVAYQGRCLGLVGESGAGKTTLARSILRLIDVDQGSIVLNGTDITSLGGRELREKRRTIQMVFQDPYTSLSPRRTVEQIVAEPIDVLGIALSQPVGDRVADLLRLVELSPDLRSRYPSQLSGGQRQRVAIARTLAAEPQIIVADEPVSALDVTIQRQLIDLFARLQRDLGLTLVIVAHDLGLVRAMCDQVAVMRNGRLVEYRDSEDIFLDPKDPYTQQLVDAARSLGVGKLHSWDDSGGRRSGSPSVGNEESSPVSTGGNAEADRGGAMV